MVLSYETSPKNRCFGQKFSDDIRYGIAKGAKGRRGRFIAVIAAKLLTVFLTNCILLLEIKNDYELKVLISRVK